MGTSEINAGKMASEIEEELFPKTLPTFFNQLNETMYRVTIPKNQDIEIKIKVREFLEGLAANVAQNNSGSGLCTPQVIADTIHYVKAQNEPMLLSEGKVLKFDIDALDKELDIARVRNALRILRESDLELGDPGVRHLKWIINLLLLGVPDDLQTTKDPTRPISHTFRVSEIKKITMDDTEDPANLDKINTMLSALVNRGGDIMQKISENLKDPDHAEKIIDGLRRLGGHTSTLGCVEAMDQLANHKLPELAVDAVGKFIVRDPQKLESLPSAEAVARRSARRS